MKTEKIFITRYDLEEITSDLEARNLLALVSNVLSPDSVKVMYKKDSWGREVRKQVRFYDLDKTIKLFEDKIKGGDVRFLKTWKKYLKILVEFREKKVEVLKIERGV